MTSISARPLSKGEAEPADDVLLARAAAGDENAFRVLADRYTGLIFSVAFRMRCNHAAAEDIVQETLLRVWRHAAGYDAAKGASVRTWLCRIATNLCIDGQRKSGREVYGDVPDSPDEAKGADSTIENQETGRLVAQALQTLPDRQRSALVLFHYEGMSVLEVASVLNTTAKGAEGLLGRARQALKRELEKFEGAL